MSVFALAWAAGGASLALWIDARHRRPAGLDATMLHAFAAWLILILMPQLLALAVDEDASQARTMLGLFTIFLPSLVYAFLACVWLLRALAGAARAH